MALTFAGVMEHIPDRVVRDGTRLFFTRHFRPFQKASRDPQGAQERLLRELVSYNQSTEFGRAHSFGSIRTWQDYRAAVPVQDYEGFEPYIERMKRGERNILTPDEPIYFGTTSGTTSRPKFIPITLKHWRDYTACVYSYFVFVTDAFPHILRGDSIRMPSPKFEGWTEAGIPYGSPWFVPRMLHQTRRDRLTKTIRMLNANQRMFEEVYNVSDFNAKYYAVLRIALARRISHFAMANPSTVLLACQKLNEFADDLIRDVETGHLNKKLPVDPIFGAFVDANVPANPALAAKMRELLRTRGLLRPIDIWPDLCAILCWKGGSAGFYISKFGRYFGDTPVMEFGIGATEGMFAVGVRPDTDGCALSLGKTLFEFIPAEAMEAGRRDVALCAHELEVGKRYYLVFSAFNGLARYNMNDVVEVVGHHENAPMIAFRHKGGNMVSYTGEKLSESQVTGAVTDASVRAGLHLQGFTVLPREGALPSYVFAVETEEHPDRAALGRLLDAIEHGLRAENCEYATKRDSLRLGDPVLKLLAPGTYHDYRKARVEGGASDATIKPPALTRDPKFTDRFTITETIEYAEMKRDAT